ncbi:MAG: Ppx/GppA family phosphatase, partial [Polyangiaceae bacterium]
MKLAALDLGSNSIHMVIADASPAGETFQVIDREKDMVKLGAGCFEGGRLTEDALAAGMRSLRKCAKLIERHGCEEVLAAATSAIREAKNGGKFLRDVTRQTGIAVRVISGEEEARLIYLAVRSVIDLAARRALILDIGGGSVEVIVGDAQSLLSSRVLKLGVLRLRDRFARRSGPLERRERKRLEDHIGEIAAPALKKVKQAEFDLAIGTSGTILALAAGARALAGKPVQDALSLTNERLARADLERLVDWLCAQPESERGKLAGVDPSRADTIHVGGVLLLELMKGAGLREIVLCSRALREGLILDY